MKKLTWKTVVLVYILATVKLLLMWLEGLNII